MCGVFNHFRLVLAIVVVAAAITTIAAITAIAVVIIVIATVVVIIAVGVIAAVVIAVDIFFIIVNLLLIRVGLIVVTSIILVVIHRGLITIILLVSILCCRWWNQVGIWFHDNGISVKVGGPKCVIGMQHGERHCGTFRDTGITDATFKQDNIVCTIINEELKGMIAHDHIGRFWWRSGFRHPNGCHSGSFDPLFIHRNDCFLDNKIDKGIAGALMNAQSTHKGCHHTDQLQSGLECILVRGFEFEFGQGQCHSRNGQRIRRLYGGNHIDRRDGGKSKGNTIVMDKLPES